MSKFGRMLEDLPVPSRAVLARPPVHQVAFALGWTQEVDFQSDAGVRWQAALRQHPILGNGTLTAAYLKTFAFSGESVSEGERLDGWQVRKPEFSASLYASTLIVEDRPYTDWDAFLEKVRPIVAALREIAAPRVRTRVMLRYTNIFIDQAAESPAFWRKKIRKEYLGFADSGAAAHLTSSIGVHAFQHGTEDAQVRMSIGINRPGGGTGSMFTLDMEVNERSITGFDTESIYAVSAAQNTACLRIFQMVLEPKFFEKLHR